MYFELGGIYHIYNHGNNRQLVFYRRENYLYFLRKLRIHIMPFADVLAWCLMPNHYHLMLEVREVEVESLAQTFSEGFTLSEALTNQKPVKTKLNHSIGVLLR